MKRLLEQLSELGVKLQLDGEDLRVTAPQGVLTAELRQALREHKASLVEALRAKKAALDEPPAIEPDPAHAHEPFPLTELQHAYWMGRVGGLAASFPALPGLTQQPVERRDRAQVDPFVEQRGPHLGR